MNTISCPCGFSLTTSVAGGTYNHKCGGVTAGRLAALESVAIQAFQLRNDWDEKSKELLWEALDTLEQVSRHSEEKSDG